MKAKEYVEKMRECDGIDDGLAMLIIGLIGEISDLRVKRGNTKKIKAIASIIREVEKKFRAVQKLAPEFWSNNEVYMSKGLVDFAGLVDPELAEAYRNILSMDEMNRNFEKSRRESRRRGR